MLVSLLDAKVQSSKHIDKRQALDRPAELIKRLTLMEERWILPPQRRTLRKNVGTPMEGKQKGNPECL
jgi:hypothetical protein